MQKCMHIASNIRDWKYTHENYRYTMHHKSLLLIQHNLREYCIGSQVPCISQATQEYLAVFLTKHKPMRCLEIGSACGYSLLTTALLVEPRGGTVCGCERAYPNRVILSHNTALVRQYGLTNYNCVFGQFLQLPITSRGNEPYDFIFVDAQKAEYPLYITHLVENKLIHENTKIIFDDVIKYQDRMTDLTQTLEQYGFKHELKQLENDDGILIVYQ